MHVAAAEDLGLPPPEGGPNGLRSSVKTSEHSSCYMPSSQSLDWGSSGRSSSRIIIGPSQVFVDAYEITLEGKDTIRDGDLGSWVVDTKTSELYGHLVASDIFNTGIGGSSNYRRHFLFSRDPQWYTNIDFQSGAGKRPGCPTTGMDKAAKVNRP
ncbi:hypothetical protein EDB81DRAFT_892346 [Dactylonectria macrodidyma]|uniref:Uncharacterized protein n=1 Tax=Dactylonectria macrodidyma TaxID=307937 RepID=A0A9P9IE65_9HYPO|nr:hypothetical protein EDB81DRAFT_892346 [Dactylonectria macrodidyma]